TRAREERCATTVLPTGSSPPERVRTRAPRDAKGARIRRSPPLGSDCLPARLGDAGQLAAVRHVTEADTRDAELREDTTGAAVDDVARTHASRRRVARQLLQADAGGLARLVGRVRVDQGLLQLSAALGVALDDDLALLVASDLALLSHGSTLLSEFVA